MAASESAGVPAYIPVIAAMIAALPVIISPIVAWVLSRSGVSKQSATIDYLNKRLDFLERINKLQVQFAEGPMKPLMDIEMEHCRAFVSQPLVFLPRAGEAGAALPQSLFARFFLTEPATSVRQRIFKGLFYVFFGVGAFSLVFSPFFLFAEMPGEEKPLSFALLLMGSAFYIVISLLFRRGARPRPG